MYREMAEALKRRKARIEAIDKVTEGWGFPAPPVCTAYWDAESWRKYIKACGVRIRKE